MKKNCGDTPIATLKIDWLIDWLFHAVEAIFQPCKWRLISIFIATDGKYCRIYWNLETVQCDFKDVIWFPSSAQNTANVCNASSLHRTDSRELNTQCQHVGLLIPISDPLNPDFQIHAIYCFETSSR